MKFRTEIDIAPLHTRIGYEHRTLALGSCFAEQIGARLARAKFRVTVNPTGTLFNPLSIVEALRSYPTPVHREERHCVGGRGFHFGVHGDFAAPTADEALRRMDAARRAGAEALDAADRVVLTLGTAWVYERGGEVVANCHRQPAAQFMRRRLTVEEVTEALAAAIEGPLAGREIILTVSPVRHLGDGLEGNAVSKAALRLAAEELAAAHAAVHYFPAYEVLNDDLRDYRFYADDLVHPSAQAVQYVREKFIPAVLSDEARRLLPDVRHIVVAAAHRPRNPRSEAYREFCRRRIGEIAALPQVDFQAEEEYFRRCIEINS